MSIKKEYDEIKNKTISKIKEAFKEFEEETGTYLIKIDVKPIFAFFPIPDAFGFVIKNNWIDVDFTTNIENNLIFKYDDRLYHKEGK